MKQFPISKTVTQRTLNQHSLDHRDRSRCQNRIFFVNPHRHPGTHEYECTGTDPGEESMCGHISDGGRAFSRAPCLIYPRSRDRRIDLRSLAREPSLWQLGNAQARALSQQLLSPLPEGGGKGGEGAPTRGRECFQFWSAVGPARQQASNGLRASSL